MASHLLQQCKPPSYLLTLLLQTLLETNLTKTCQNYNDNLYPSKLLCHVCMLVLNDSFHFVPLSICPPSKNQIESGVGGWLDAGPAAALLAVIMNHEVVENTSQCKHSPIHHCKLAKNMTKHMQSTCTTWHVVKQTDQYLVDSFACPCTKYVEPDNWMYWRV